MHTKLPVAAAGFVAAALVAGVATAGRTSVQQRIAITSPTRNAGVFVLRPLTPGAIVRDSGTAIACCWTQRFAQRDGQSIVIDNPLRRFEGKRGTSVWRAQITFLDLDNGDIDTGGRGVAVRDAGGLVDLGR